MLIFKVLTKEVDSNKQKQLFALLGAVLLLLIIPIKIMRYFESPVWQSISNNTPSFLGSAGLFLILLADRGRLANIKVYQAFLITLIISILIECLQLVPRPGILSKIYYVFDFNDLVASFAGVIFSFLVAAILLSGKNNEIKQRSAD
jgi:hypothetical protein